MCRYSILLSAFYHHQHHHHLSVGKYMMRSGHVLLIHLFIIFIVLGNNNTYPVQRNTRGRGPRRRFVVQFKIDITSSVYYYSPLALLPCLVLVLVLTMLVDFVPIQTSLASVNLPPPVVFPGSRFCLREFPWLSHLASIACSNSCVVVIGCCKELGFDHMA